MEIKQVDMPKTESVDGQDAAEAPKPLRGIGRESTFGKPGEIVQEAVSGMDKVAGVSGEERRVPHAHALRRDHDFDAPKFKPTHRVVESPTSTAPAFVSPAYGSEGPREHRD